MRISGVSSALNKNITNMMSNKSNPSDKQNNALEKQKSQIQSQISQVEESNLPKDVKAAKIKALQEDLQEVEQKSSEEKAKKKLEKSEVKTTDKKSKIENEENLKSEDDENSQPLNKDVVYGMASASTHMKIGKVAYSVYKDAKNKGKTDVAQRALSYASSEFKESGKSIKLVAKGISEYKKQISIAEKDAAADKNPNDNTVKISADTTKIQSDDTVKTSADNTAKTSTDDTVKEKAVINKLA